jgi:hypothetical protein
MEREALDLLVNLVAEKLIDLKIESEKDGEEARERYSQTRAALAYLLDLKNRASN